MCGALNTEPFQTQQNYCFSIVCLWPHILKLLFFIESAYMTSVYFYLISVSVCGRFEHKEYNNGVSFYTTLVFLLL